MKNKVVENQSRKIGITLLLMLALVGISAFISRQISKMEEQTCWDQLHQSVQQISSEMENHVKSDQELLSCVADIILEQDGLDSPQVQNIIDGFHPNTMISHIALLLPENRVMLPNEPIRDASGVLSFEEEAALGTHISDRSVDIRDENRLILRNFVPIIKDNETIAMLYGVVDLSTLADKSETAIYDGQASVYIIDGNTGNFIMDTWHGSLGNMSDIGSRKTKKGYSQEQMQNDVFEVKAGHCIFESESIGEYLYFYYEPMSVNKWMIGISVTESAAFAGMKKINRLLFIFITAEIVLLALYFIWLLLSTKKELHEKQKMADIDVLTELLNRNCYEKNLEKYPSECSADLTCIYADANGLHELNDTKGHEAGDKMLQTVAQLIKKHFGHEDTYRIGGDEFVAFAKDEPMDEIQSKIEKINNGLTEKGYHASIGVCRQEKPIEIDELIKQAEQHMYEEKALYYTRTGKDRRRRF